MLAIPFTFTPNRHLDTNCFNCIAQRSIINHQHTKLTLHHALMLQTSPLAPTAPLSSQTFPTINSVSQAFERRTVDMCLSSLLSM